MAQENKENKKVKVDQIPLDCDGTVDVLRPDENSPIKYNYFEIFQLIEKSSSQFKKEVDINLLSNAQSRSVDPKNDPTPFSAFAKFSQAQGFTFAPLLLDDINRKNTEDQEKSQPEKASISTTGSSPSQ